MIPDRDDFWLVSDGSRPNTSPTPTATATLATAPDTAVDRLQKFLCHRPDPNSAWHSYQRYVEALEANGRKYDQSQVLNAMFRGADLVYRGSVDS